MRLMKIDLKTVNTQELKQIIGETESIILIDRNQLNELIRNNEAIEEIDDWEQRNPDVYGMNVRISDDMVAKLRTVGAYYVVESWNGNDMDTDNKDIVIFT